VSAYNKANYISDSNAMQSSGRRLKSLARSTDYVYATLSTCLVGPTWPWPLRLLVAESMLQLFSSKNIKRIPRCTPHKKVDCVMGLKCSHYLS